MPRRAFVAARRALSRQVAPAGEPASQAFPHLSEAVSNSFLALCPEQRRDLHLASHCDLLYPLFIYYKETYLLQRNYLKEFYKKSK